ncbi:MAG: hypothetical protein ACRYFY_16620 [Janthinobacterium lividum]
MNRSVSVTLAFLAAPFTATFAQAGTGPTKLAHLTGAVVQGDLPFRGMIALAVDATDTDHRIFTIHETIPVQTSGSVKLLYPEWETGSHAPTASVVELAGLVTSIDDRRQPWHRDPVDVHAFRLDVPPAAKTIDVDFQLLAPHSAALLRPDMVDVQWHRLLLYPAGWPANDISVAARLTLPHGLHAFTALPTDRSDGDTIRFAPVSLETLVDAPVYAARYWRQLDLAPDATVPVRLDIVADAAAALAVPVPELAKLRALVVQTACCLGRVPIAITTRSSRSATSCRQAAGSSIRRRARTICRSPTSPISAISSAIVT